MAMVIAAASVAALLWAYVGYPLALACLRSGGPSVTRNAPPRRVCVVIAAHNARRWIRGKLRNTRALRWPREMLQIVVVSDGSTDDTAARAIAAAGPDTTVIELGHRAGKSACLGMAVRATDADVVVFTDVATRLEPDALEVLLRRFREPDVGCVSGTDRARSAAGATQGESLYVRYEMWLRRIEASARSMVSASGCLFAVRRELCDPWLEELTPDFAIPLLGRTRGYRTVCDTEAIAHYPVTCDPVAEFERKVRTVVHGLRTAWHFRHCLNPLRDPLLALQLFSHKVLRWLTPFLLLILLVCSALSSSHPVWLAIVAAQALVYALALGAWCVTSTQERLIPRCLAYFALANAAILVAWARALGSDRLAWWEPSHG